MRAGHLAVPRAQGKQTRTPGGGTASPDPDPSHRPRSHRPGRAAPAHHVPESAARPRRKSKGARRPGQRGPPVESPGQWELKGCSGPRNSERGGGEPRPRAQARGCAAVHPLPTRRRTGPRPRHTPSSLARAVRWCDGRQGLGGRGAEGQKETVVSARPPGRPHSAYPPRPHDPGTRQQRLQVTTTGLRDCPRPGWLQS